MSEAQAALLVGGPKHGEPVIVGVHQHELVLVTSPTTACCFNENGYAPHPAMVSFKEERYRRMEDVLPPVFEHESLWDANVQRAAERLDREIAAAAERHNVLKRQANAAAARAGCALDDLVDLSERRDAITLNYGI